METVKSFLQAVALLLAIMLILYNTYTGVMIQEIGIPGFAMVKFGSQAQAEPSSSTVNAPSQSANRSTQIEPTEHTSETSSATDCIITISNPLVPLMQEPDPFSQELSRIEVGDYLTLGYMARPFVNQNQGWFQIEVDGRIGWVRNDTWTVAKKTSACL